MAITPNINLDALLGKLPTEAAPEAPPQTNQPPPQGQSNVPSVVAPPPVQGFNQQDEYARLAQSVIDQDLARGDVPYRHGPMGDIPVSPEEQAKYAAEQEHRFVIPEYQRPLNNPTPNQPMTAEDYESMLSEADSQIMGGHRVFGREVEGQEAKSAKDAGQQMHQNVEAQRNYLTQTNDGRNDLLAAMGAWGVTNNPQAQAEMIDVIPYAQEVGFQTLAAKAKTYGFEKQAGFQEERERDESTMTEMEKIQHELMKGAGAKAKEVVQKQQTPKEALDTFQVGLNDINNQPALRDSIDTIARSMTAFIGNNTTASGQNTGGAGAQITPEQRNVAMRFMRQMAEEGQIKFALNNGKLLPVISDEATRGHKFSSQVAQLYDPVLRHQATKDPVVTSTPFITAKSQLATEIERVYAQRGGWRDPNGNGFKMSSATQSLLSAVVVEGDPVNIKIGQAMVEDIFNNTKLAVEGFQYSDSMYANSGLNEKVGGTAMTEIYRDEYNRQKEIAQKTFPNNPEKVESVAKEQAVQATNRYYGAAISRGRRHWTEYADGPPSSVVYHLGTNNRFNMAGTDRQSQAHKGTLRNGQRWKNVAKTTGITQEKLDGIVDKAKKIFSNQLGLSGEALGTNIIDSLDKLGNNDEQIMDSLYVIGALYIKTVKPEMVEKMNGEMNYADIVAQGLAGLSEMANIGMQLENFNGNLDTVIPLSNGSQMNLSDLLQNKGEWGGPISVFRNAYRLNTALQASKVGTPQTADLNYFVEADSRQSNAMLMSTLMGSSTIFDLLTNLLDLQDTPEAADLRALATDRLTQEWADDKGSLRKGDIMELFGDSEPEVRDALINFFKGFQRNKSKAKLYARGVACAGLYGKTPIKMYEETAKFLAEPSLQKEVATLKQVYREQFGAQSDKNLADDITQLMAKSMTNHMGDLISFQNIMKAVQDVRGAVGNTQIPSMVPGETLDATAQDILSHLDAEQIQKLASKLLGGTENNPSLLTGAQEIGGGLEAVPWSTYQTPDARNPELNPEVAQTRQAIGGFDAQENVSFYGEKTRAMLPPILIHSADAYGIIVSTLAANQGRLGKGKGVAPMSTIHDAILSGPGSTLRTLVAYNNIYPHLMAKRGNDYLTGLVSSTDTAAAKKISSILKEGKGVMIGDNSLENKSIMGFFDRHYFKLKSSPEELAKANLSNATGLYTERQYQRRLKAELQQEKRSLEKSRAIVEAAQELGWLPPLKINQSERRNLTLTPQNAAEAIWIIYEASGLAPYNKFRHLKHDGKANWVVANIGGQVERIDPNTGIKYAKTAARADENRKKKQQLLKDLAESNRQGRNMQLELG